MAALVFAAFGYVARCEAATLANGNGEGSGMQRLWSGDRVETAMLAGADGVFHPAQADIGFGGRLLRLASAAVIAPERVRYAWSNNPVMANLGGENGLPVSPFEVSADDRFSS